MRYRGGGVGHMPTRQCNEVLLADKHTLLREEPPAQDSDSDEDSAGDGNEDEEAGNESDGEDEGIGEVNDDDLVAADNDVELLTAAGFADL